MERQDIRYWWLSEKSSITPNDMKYANPGAENYILNKTAILPVVIQYSDNFVYDIVTVYDLVSV
jgi:hypothetical protein